MSKIFIIGLIAFFVYVFCSISIDAKREITKTTVDIPVKITQTINSMVENTAQGIIDIEE